MEFPVPEVLCPVHAGGADGIPCHARRAALWQGFLTRARNARFPVFGFWARMRDSNAIFRVRESRGESARSDPLGGLRNPGEGASGGRSSLVSQGQGAELLKKGLLRRNDSSVSRFSEPKGGSIEVLIMRSLRSWKLCIILLCITAMPSFAIIETFNSQPPGTVVAGDLPGGGTAPGTLFPFITFSVTNTGDGPNSLIIFDSSNPTGEDWDLGTPNQDFGGPGIGYGGKEEQPGENFKSYGHLLIVAENIIDNNQDGLVDNPDDEEGGGPSK